MKYQVISILTCFILFLGCNSKKDSDNKSEKTFGVSLLNFSPEEEVALTNKLENKSFQFNNGEISQQKGDQTGHKFYINKKESDFNTIIKVKKIREVQDSLKVNIIFFERDGNSLKQYFNPGNFNIKTNTLEDKADQLQQLIVKLTFK
ncbi:hypothetical protein [uncultured Marixanthomonas sp.]|uniref:hypothetical protein n=1 Tax=uncultured Marixanthomonas sp. TaxID=757245 RepID=UPI0030DCF44E|tara:strand:+ start:1940 stop:2383 length:444 start_codon:yes stop_codon:yes gene_type:complete